MFDFFISFIFLSKSLKNKNNYTISILISIFNIFDFDFLSECTNIISLFYIEIYFVRKRDLIKNHIVIIIILF